MKNDLKGDMYMKGFINLIFVIAALCFGIVAFTEAILTIGQYPTWMTIMGFGVGIGLIPDAIIKLKIIDNSLKD